MTLWKAQLRWIGAVVLTGAVLTQAVEAQTSCVQRDTPTIIQPGDPRWLLDLNTYPDDLNNAAGAITATNPRSGTGSLELTTSGSLFDWAFFQRTAGAGAWGLLSEVNCLAFEWYREPYLLAGNADPALLAETWLEQTPALRVMVRDLVDNTWLISHLVWEGWYNSPGVLSPTSTGTWNYENLTEQLFWRHFDGGLSYTNTGCFNGSFIGSNALQTFSLSGWVQNCYSPNAEVFGLMVGVGSMWPGEYRGWVDNVQLAFEGQNGFTLEDNFDLPGRAPRYRSRRPWPCSPPDCSAWRPLEPASGAGKPTPELPPLAAVHRAASDPRGSEAVRFPPQPATVSGAAHPQSAPRLTKPHPVPAHTRFFRRSARE